MKDLVTEYLEHLMGQGDYQGAAAQCPALLGHDAEQWEMYEHTQPDIPFKQ